MSVQTGGQDPVMRTSSREEDEEGRRPVDIEGLLRAFGFLNKRGSASDTRRRQLSAIVHLQSGETGHTSMTRKSLLLHALFIPRAVFL